MQMEMVKHVRREDEWMNEGVGAYDYHPSVKARQRSKVSLTRGLVNMSAGLSSLWMYLILISLLGPERWERNQ